MPNLVGIGNSQVPTNAMLGGLAYQDSVGDIDIEKIKAKIGDTATAIFVYDTRKDSDGGAWRKKATTQSWYNEGANQYRGARKEFPAVAVIVAATSPSYQLTIYDGDDPNMPLWMKWYYVTNDPFFDYSTPGSHHLGNYAPGSISAMNGIICVGTFRSAGAISNLNAGVREFHFIKDECFAINDDKRVKFPTNIADRNVVTANYRQVVPHPSTASSRVSLVNANVNDVAMAVLPNAPIDESTGLPVPTIAVTTDGGTNIIQDDGIVAQGYQTIATEHVDLHPDGYMLDGITGAVNDSYSLYNISETERVASYGHRVAVHPIVTFINHGTGEILFEGDNNKIAITSTLGLLRIKENFSNYTSGLHNRTTSSYNTGWMLANVKGAFLSSIDDTNVTGSELLANPGPSFSNTTNWYLDASNKDTGTIATLTVSSGRLVFTHSDTNSYWDGFGASFTCTVGEVYVVRFDIHSVNNFLGQ